MGRSGLVRRWWEAAPALVLFGFRLLSCTLAHALLSSPLGVARSFVVGRRVCAAVRGWPGTFRLVEPVRYVLNPAASPVPLP